MIKEQQKKKKTLKENYNNINNFILKKGKRYD